MRVKTIWVILTLAVLTAGIMLSLQFTHRGHEVTRSEARRLNEAKVAEPHVTPDTLDECPKCGHRFRVGKKLV